jgi:hypothetical protein
MGLFTIIDRFHTWSNSLIKGRFPLLSLYYYNKPRSYVYWSTQPVHRLIKGNLKPGSDKKSVIFFTVHKSASTFFDRYLKELSKESGHIHIDLNGYFGTQWKKWLEMSQDQNFLQKIAMKKGLMYGPLRNYVPFPDLEDYKIVLVLRDPRDVLTSQYFSIKNSHPLMTPELIKRHKAAQSATIDEHVLGQADRFVNTYNAYLDHVIGKKNVLFIKYETLISDFRNCLEMIDKHCELDLSPEQLILLDRTEKFKIKEEDQKSHVRKVSAGDHKEKLKPETIRILNEKFGPILKNLDYPL